MVAYVTMFSLMLYQKSNKLSVNCLNYNLLDNITCICFEVLLFFPFSLSHAVTPMNKSLPNTVILIERITARFSITFSYDRYRGNWIILPLIVTLCPWIPLVVIHIERGIFSIASFLILESIKHYLFRKYFCDFFGGEITELLLTPPSIDV